MFIRLFVVTFNITVNIFELDIISWNMTPNSLDTFQKVSRFVAVTMKVAEDGSVLMWAPAAAHTCTQQPAIMPSETKKVTGSNLWFLLGQFLVPWLPVSSAGCSEPKTQYKILFLSLLALNHRGMYALRRLDHFLSGNCRHLHGTPMYTSVSLLINQTRSGFFVFHHVKCRNIPHFCYPKQC